jgi:hypothetical protein
VFWVCDGDGEAGRVTWTKLDDGFWSNPKVEDVGNEAAGAYVRMLSYCGQHLTDGHVKHSAARYVTTSRILKRLVEFGFIEPTGEGWVVPDYLEFNKSREEVEATRRARSEAGKRGGESSSKGSSK